MAICPSGHESASDDFCDVCGLSIGAPPLSSIDAGAPLTPAASGAPGAGATLAAPAGGVCPRCGTAQTGQFCEDCGYNFAVGGASYAPPPPAYAPPSSPPDYPGGPGYPGSPAYPPSAPAPAYQSAPGAPASPFPGRESSVVRGNGTAQPTGAWWAVVTADRDYFDSVQAASGPEAAGIGFPAYCPERRFRLSGTEVRIGRRSASRGIEPEIDLTGPPSDPGISRLHAVLLPAPDGSWSVLDPGSANGTLVNGAEIRQDQPVPLHDGDRINLGAWTLVTIWRD